MRHILCKALSLGNDPAFEWFLYENLVISYIYIYMYLFIYLFIHTFIHSRVYLYIYFFFNAQLITAPSVPF
jgi:hypothetical protein